jgi:hypothetical protein
MPLEAIELSELQESCATRAERLAPGIPSKLTDAE